ncbi:transposase [Rhizobium sp. DBTS2]|uniref:Mutator family transposase n=1 Tax=Mycoplana rhizolycopersici TaxID=2746702 RepID=A0ABX2QQS9_9HYPH|nr:transposase [Rhizobium rhizolycopersici]NVP58664.1 transposase [Rhizobium rhizolycopersici]
MATEKELPDRLLAGRDPSEVFGKDGLLDDLKKALSERILNAELDEHLDLEHSEGPSANRRKSRRRNWEYVVSAFPEGVRRIIYTTNAIEALNSKLRRAVRSRGHFPGDEAAMKLLYLVLSNAAELWKRVPRKWGEKTPFAVIFGERFFN